MHPDQYMIYYLVSWNEEKNKWNKKPVGLDGSPLPTEQGIPTSTDRASVERTVTALGDRYRLGLWLAVESNFFFLDLDDNAVQDGRLTPLANSMAEPFIRAGCYFEASTSGRGAHVIGRYHGVLQPFATSRKRVHPHEFFVRDRGVVLSAVSQGSWNADATALLAALLTEHFPPRHTGEQELRDFHDGPAAEWRGPTNDDDLIRKFLAASGSAAAKLRGSISLVDLWNGNCQHTSENDLGLASHLAFWTGCDAARIERLMRRSPLATHRIDKWDSHRTYLRELTIREACVTTKNVYEEPVRIDTAAALLGVGRPPLKPLAAPSVGLPPAITDAVVIHSPEDWHTVTDKLISEINSTGTLRELELLMTTLSGYGLPEIHVNRASDSLRRKLDTFNTKLNAAQLRSLFKPPVDLTQQLTQQAVPDWAQSIVYVLATDSYFDVSTATEYSVSGLRAKFSREMPMKANGQREDPAQWLQDRWSMVTVDDTEYRPNLEPIFEADGRTYANDFRASSIPVPVLGSEEAGQCVGLFLQHLYAMVNRRDNLYHQLIGWIAHNARYPGKKIRWSPLLQGSAGVGKSIFTELFNASLGRSNVKSTSSATLSNSGGFTDWAIGACVNVIEELKLDSKESRRLYNTMKTYIADDDIDVNRKGRPAGRKMVNVTNHWANTNYRGTLQIDMGDRRWCVIFTPWEDANSAARSKGLASADELPSFFNRIASSMRREPGAWRSWLLGIDIGYFNPDSRAPFTEEREAMRQGSGDFLEQTIEDCIQRGGTGVGVEAFCSHSLMGMVNVALGEKPDSKSWNRILGELGYQQAPSTVWWNNRTRRVWSKISRTNAELRDYLDKTTQSQTLL